MQISTLVIEVSIEYEKNVLRRINSVNLFLFILVGCIKRWIYEITFSRIYIYTSSNLFKQIYQFLFFVISFQRESKIESYKYSTPDS